jgi:hypothetical protein
LEVVAAAAEGAEALQVLPKAEVAAEEERGFTVKSPFR